MFKQSLISAGLLCAVATTASAAPYGFFDARSVAMGNVSVATGNLATAALSNPAMLSVNESKDSFALLIPAFGVQAIDNGGMIDVLDEYQGLVDQYNAASGNTALQISLVNQMNTLLPEFNNTNVAALLSANAVLAYAGDSFSMAGFYRGTGQASININSVAGTGSTLPVGTLNAYGYSAQEIGVSLATKISVAGMDLSVGVTPKTVQVDSIRYSANFNTVDTADVLSDATETDLGSFTTFDAGVALQLSDSVTFGLVAKNILEETLVSGTETYIFDTQLRVGAAYHNEFITIAADMDLTETEGSKTTDPLLITETGSKMVALGVEFDMGDIVQLRVGYQTNQASGSTEPDLLSAGIGLWLGFHLDAAVVVGDDSSLGAFVQTGFRF